jgi:hypothetical protein
MGRDFFRERSNKPTHRVETSADPQYDRLLSLASILMPRVGTGVFDRVIIIDLIEAPTISVQSRPW